MKELSFPVGPDKTGFNLPDETDILTMPHPKTLPNPDAAVFKALNEPIGTHRIERIVADKAAASELPPAELTACIVISDITRPVPYTGKAGILWPIAEKLINIGIKPSKILVLVATGTHREQSIEELHRMLDVRVFEAGIQVKNHDSRDIKNLINLGKTSRGSDIIINSSYMNADIKILTGLVESHFMAGVSGGRKSICPGLIGEESTYIFHGASMLANAKARALKLEGNPCHEESLEMALAAGADYIVNVTLDGKFNLTGVFAGDLEKAHLAAADHLKSYTAIPVSRKYDIVVTHAGFVGINHYQAAKAGVEAARVVRDGGYILMGADNTDDEAIGGSSYPAALQLLKIIGQGAFDQLILSPDWPFLIDQWQVQMWSRMFRIIPQDHFYYYSPQFSREDYRICPGEPLTELSGQKNLSIPEQLTFAVDALQKKLGRVVSICWMADGPYGVPDYL
ncbi:MAG TPA: hypothetical protein DCO79_16025 [Spirochaeta sp.]|nr:hypothetical protein [Spirochaeta sp.]